jgi:hypothetical protein
MASNPSQRAYTAPCPGCGAPVNFASAQSTHAVCGYCQSSIVRTGEVLSRIGKMAELFDDHSPLQLQAAGSWRGQGFTLLGRLQYKYGEGTWTEWYALLADGSNAYLSEDNGAYVFATPQAVKRAMPAPEQFKLGATTAINGETFSVASNQQVMLLSAQGELPRLPALGQSFAMVELRSQGLSSPPSGAPSVAPENAAGASMIGRNLGAGADTAAAQANAAEAGGAGTSQGGKVLSIDYSTQPPTVTMGQPVQLEDLQLTGLREASVKSEAARQFNCPHCGASVSITLAASQSVSCPSCKSLIDVSGGIGGELKSALQDEPVQPLIALGSVGQLQGVAWQVVGFQHRMGTDPSDPDEQFGWEEYLLYNQQRGFIFLVDSTDGWSVVKPATGAPVMSANGQSASYLGSKYQLKESYDAETTYALGEFYWQVTRGQRTANRDFASGFSILSMEQSASEVVWSVGSQIDSDKVAAAFKLEGKKDLLKRSDAVPVSAGMSMTVGTLIVIFVLLMLLSMIVSRCSDCDPKVENCASSSSRSSGGSFGGFSSGGGHK